MKDPKKPRKLNIRERKTVKGIIEGKSVNQAMRDAGYANTTAKGRGKQKLEDVAPTIQALMDKMGITDERLMEVLKKGLDAKKHIVVSDGAQNGSHIEEVDDLSTSHKYLETGLKVKGHLNKDPSSGEGTTITLKILYEQIVAQAASDPLVKG